MRITKVLIFAFALVSLVILRPDVADAQGPATQKATKPSPAKGAGKAKTDFQSVIAEGIGETPENALKDAFRNAVQEVVGALVDAETHIKNDAIISDKVLTYSGGFVKTYKELAKEVKDGLHTVRIS